MQALIIKEFRELARDRRTLAMLVVLPVILLIVFGYAANFSVDKVSVAVIGSEAQSAADKLDDYGAARDKLDITQVDHNRGVEDAEQLLRDRTADVVVVADRPAGGAVIGWDAAETRGGSRHATPSRTGTA